MITGSLRRTQRDEGEHFVSRPMRPFRVPLLLRVRPFPGHVVSRPFESTARS